MLKCPVVVLAITLFLAHGACAQMLPPKPKPMGPHSARDHHTIAQLLLESGAYEAFPDGKIPAGENLVVGKIFVSDSANCYTGPNPGVRAIPASEDKGFEPPFRIALMMCPDEGKCNLDFFKGIKAKPGRGLSDAASTLGTGNAVQLHMGYYSKPFRNWPYAGKSFAKPPYNSKAIDDYVEYSTAQFEKCFPECFRKGPGASFPNFRLTFKEFKNHAYYLRNVPKGTAFLFIQVPFDGNKFNEFPILLKLDPKLNGITRIDIRTDSFGSFFSDL